MSIFGSIFGGALRATPAAPDLRRMLNYTQIDRHPFTTLAKAVKTPGHHCSWCGSRFREPQVEGCKNCGGPWE